MPCSVCWLPSWRPHRSITDNRDSSTAMESLPAIDCSIVCELFINDLLGMLANSTATHMVHFCMSLLVSCIYTFVLFLPVWNLPLKHCWITYDVIKLQTVEYKTCISDKYMPNTFNGSHNSILKKLPEYSIISFNTFKFVKFTWSHSRAHSFHILINKLGGLNHS